MHPILHVFLFLPYIPHALSFLTCILHIYFYYHTPTHQVFLSPFVIFLRSCLHHLFFSFVVYNMYIFSYIVYYTHFSHFHSSCFLPPAYFMYLCTYSVHVFFINYTLHEHYYASVWNRSWPLRLQTPSLCHLTTVAIADSSLFFTLPNPFFPLQRS